MISAAGYGQPYHFPFNSLFGQYPIQVNVDYSQIIKTIGISALLKSSRLRRMLDALDELLDVRFEERAFGDYAGLYAWIVPEANRENLHRIVF